MPVITSEAPSGAGPATRAVYASYHRELEERRRWVVAERLILAVVAITGLLVLAAGPLGLSEAVAPLVVISPFGILGGWLVWRDQILTLLGRPAEPRFPTQMLEIALRADGAARPSRPFDSFPADSPAVRAENH